MDLSTRRIRKNAHDGVDKKKPHLLFCCGAMMAARFRSLARLEMRKPLPRQGLRLSGSETVTTCG